MTSNFGLLARSLSPFHHRTSLPFSQVVQHYKIPTSSTNLSSTPPSIISRSFLNPPESHLHRQETRMSSNQNVIVMRHGDRRDNFDPMWVTTAERPWDPPLVDQGKARAFSVGHKLKTELGFPIHRVFVSPFIRCIQTANAVISALCAVDDVIPGKDVTGENVSIDPSRIKVAIEYGLCEMLNREAIRPGYSPKDGDFGFELSKLEALFPAGTIDHTVEPVYKEMPRWEETVLGARARYEHVIEALADKYPSENLLLVTHGEGVGTSVSAFSKGAIVYEVNYCAFAHARRALTFDETKSFKAESFQLLTGSGENGIGYTISGSMSDGV